MVDLGTLGGTYSFASDVNDNDVVVGYSYTAGDAAVRATMWLPPDTDGDGVPDL